MPGSTPSTPPSAQLGDHPGRGRLRKHAAVAGTAQVRREDRGLALETKNRPVDVWFLEENADVVREITRRKIVRAVDHDVIRLDQPAGVFAREQAIVQVHLHVGIDVFDAVPGRIEFLAADIRRAVQDLPLQIGKIDDIEIHQPHPPHPGGGQIQGDGRAKAPCPDAQHPGGFEAFLPAERHFRHDQMARITRDLIIAQRDGLCAGGIDDAAAGCGRLRGHGPAKMHRDPAAANRFYVPDKVQGKRRPPMFLVAKRPALALKLCPMHLSPTPRLSEHSAGTAAHQAPCRR